MIRDIRTLLGDDYEPFAHVVNDSIGRAYEASIEHHDPGVGHNATTFGTLVWHSSAYFLITDLADALPHCIVTRPDNSLRFQIGSTAFYVSKAGHRPYDNPDEFAFDQSAIRRRIAVENDMMRLFEIDAAQQVVSAVPEISQNVMIAHCGNPLDGMCRIDVGAIRPAKKGESPWMYRDNLYIRREDLAPIEDVVAAVEPWSEKPVTELELTRKKKPTSAATEAS